MSTLKAALAWAARGFRVFPLQPNSKDPLDVGWTSSATTDPAAIKAWWTDPVTGAERDYNIGSLTSHNLVPDVDTKEGKPGLKTMADLGLEFDTLTVATPSGGYHLWYEGLGEPTGQSPLGPGVDLRSHNGYVVAPGSVLNGVEYRVVIDQPLAPFPEHLRGRLKRPRERAVQILPDIELDQPEFLEIAADWLRKAAPSSGTYIVACRMRDFGLSEAAAADLMFEVWNPLRAVPRTLDELKLKVAHAFTYATGTPGSSTAQAAFADIEILPLPANPANPTNSVDPYQFGNALDADKIEKRPWVFGNLLLNHTVTGLVAASGAGKSLTKLIIAAHLAAGKDWLGHKCFRSGKSIVFDGEDDLMEMSRRLHAICVLYQLDWEVVRRNVCLITQDQLMLQLTSGEQFPKINLEQIATLIQHLRDPEIVFLAIGPLVELHNHPENDSAAMKYVMGVLRLIARQGDVAVLVDHHTAKPPAASSQAWVGDQYAGRGSSAFAGSVRRQVTMYAASEQDCAELAVPVAQRKDFVRMDDGKVSYGKVGGARWLRWQEVRLLSGDDVGVLVPFEVKDSVEGAARALAGLLEAEMRKQSTSLLKIEEALSVMMRDPLTAREGRAVARNRLERALAEPVSTGTAEVRLERSSKGLEGVVMR